MNLKKYVTEFNTQYSHAIDSGNWNFLKNIDLNMLYDVLKSDYLYKWKSKDLSSSKAQHDWEIICPTLRRIEWCKSIRNYIRSCDNFKKLYPDWFNYVGLFSAHVHLDVKDRADLQAKGCCFTPESERMLQTQFKKKPALYWIAIGKDDFLYDNNKMYREYLDQKGYPYEYVETDGGHIWRNWRIYLTQFSQSLFK